MLIDNVNMSDEPKVGRPTKYKPEYVEALIKYFDREPYEEKLVKIITKSGDVIEVPKNEATDFPTLAGFAIKIGVCKDTLQEWAKVHEEFSVAYKRAKDFQENYMAINGNKGLLQANFAIFTSKNVLGWRDKQPDENDVVINNTNTNNITLDEVDAKLKKLREEEQK